ncbi:MAG: hypothetical protein EP306_10255 [Burkholderiales bacterium]|nr:MAG: hypothetical protein EP306_10255 [Burkholderiales bacterium]
MSQSVQHLPPNETGDLPVSLRALMQQLGRAAGVPGQQGATRFFDALRAICLTVDPSLLWQGGRADLAGFLAALSSIEDRVRGGSLDEASSLDALMAVLAVHGFLSPAARPVLSDRLSRSLASYRPQFQPEAPADASPVVDWNALGVRLMRPASDRPGQAPDDGETGWEAFPPVHPQGQTLH